MASDSTTATAAIATTTHAIHKTTAPADGFDLVASPTGSFVEAIVEL